MKQNKITQSILLSFLALSNHSFAAVTTPAQASAVSAVDAGVVQKRLRGDLYPTFNEGAEAPKRPTEKQSAFSDEVGKLKFKLTQVTIEGNTVFSDAELNAIFAPYIDKTISLAELQQLVDDITVKYRTAGYILSRAILPPQTIAGGKVTVQVIEGYVSEVNVEGNPGVAKPLIQKYGERIKTIRPITVKGLERNVLLIDDLPGINEKAVIVPSKITPGGAELTLVTERQPVNAYYAYDNYSTRYLGPQENSAGITLNSMMFGGDSNAFSTVVTPNTNLMQFYQFIHTQPLGSNGTQLSFGSNYSYTKPGFTLEPFDIISRSFFLYADIMHPFVRSRSFNFLMHGSFNYQNITSTILGTPFYADRDRSFVIGAKLNAVDSWRGINNVGLDFEQGLIMWGNQQNINQSRPNAVPNFSKFDLTASRLQIFNSRFSGLLAMEGQYSCNPVIATEQYAYGGPNFGRGYDPAAIIGDSAFAGKAELRADTSPEWQWLHTVQYYIFYDGGVIWNRSTLGLPPKQSAVSTGIGARFGFIPQVSANFYIAKPLTFPVQTLQQLGHNPNQLRTFFQLVASV